MSEILLSARGINKSFASTRALIDVDLDICTGEVLGLIGENGSGKSTFSSIVAGAQPKDSGNFMLRGEAYNPSSMVDAQNRGVTMILQETGIIPGIDVTSNIFAGRLGLFAKGGFVNWRKAHAKANEILEHIGAPEIRGEMPVGYLDFEDCKIVEIARAMSDDPDLLIIDETTTALATKGRTLLYKLIERLRSSNKSVLFISHDLDELMEVCDKVTVLRDGVIIDTLDKAQMNPALMRELMVGRELVGDYYRPDIDGSCGEEVVLRADRISMRPFFTNISFQLHRGEILGLGGLSDCGMHEIGKVLSGFYKPLTGAVQLGNGEMVSSAAMSVANHMAYISKDRDKESIILNATIKSNIVLPSLRNMQNRASGYISKKSERDMTVKEISQMRIKCRDENQMVKELSGGNKQKVVFSKWLATDADIYIMDCPTRGIDVGVKADMYKLMMELKKRGKSILLISEEILELIGMSDRILLLKDGRFTKEFHRHDKVKEQDIIQYII